MAVISVSIDGETLKAADEAIRVAGFRNRSDLFRKGVKEVAAEVRRGAGLGKEASCVLVMVHEERHEAGITPLKHEFEDVIAMQTHSKLDEKNCLEIFVLKGNGKRIGEFANRARADKRMGYVKLVAP